MDLDILREQLIRNLNDADAGRVLCDVRDDAAGGLDDGQRIAVYLQAAFTLRVEPAHLHRMNRDMALHVATRVIRGLFVAAKNAKESVPDARAFLALFAPDAHFYSTASYTADSGLEEYSAVGRSLLDADFEEGVFAIDEHKVGVLWVGDCD